MTIRYRITLADTGELLATTKTMAAAAVTVGAFPSTVNSDINQYGVSCIGQYIIEVIEVAAEPSATKLTTRH